MRKLTPFCIAIAPTPSSRIAPIKLIDVSRREKHGWAIWLEAVVLADLAINVIDIGFPQRSQQNDAAVIVDLEVLLRERRTTLEWDDLQIQFRLGV
jgi:hypothetical protein